MCQEKKEQMVDGGFRIDKSPDEFVHCIAQHQCEYQYQ